MTKLIYKLRYLIAFIIFLGLWFIASEIVFAGSNIISLMGPGDAIFKLLEKLQDNRFLEAISVSLSRILIALLVSLILGVVIGSLLGAKSSVENATSPIVQIIRMTSPLAWAPLIIVLLGAKSISVVVLIILAAIWPIIISTSKAVRNLDKRLINLSKSLGADRLETLKTIIIPSILGDITSSLRISLGVAWATLVPAEMFGVTNGLGYTILNARDNVDYAYLAAAMLAIGIIGFILDYILKFINSLVYHADK